MLDRIFSQSGEAAATALSFTNLVALLVLGLLGFLSASTYTTWRRLKYIPGPPSAGLSKWWMLRNTLGGNMHLALKAACDTYGKRWLVTPQGLQVLGSLSRQHQTRHADVLLAHQPETPVRVGRMAARRQAVGQSPSVG